MPSAFAHILSRIVTKLKDQGMSMNGLAEQWRQLLLPPGATAVHHTDLSGWCRGRNAITIRKLRGLVAGLNQPAFHRLAEPVTPEDIASLITAAGFRPQDLTDTTHDVIRGIDDHTEIKPLLRSIRQATDLAIPAPRDWRANCERSGKDYLRPQQVYDLLHSYNHVIRDNGFPPMTDDEIAKVVSVAERDHASRRALAAEASRRNLAIAMERRHRPAPSPEGEHRAR